MITREEPAIAVDSRPSYFGALFGFSHRDESNRLGCVLRALQHELVQRKRATTLENQGYSAGQQRQVQLSAR